MDFIRMRDKLIAHFDTMVEDATHLFEVELNKDVLWNLYLDSFPAGTNPMHRTRRYYDCNCCHHFIKTMGNVVAIKDNQITTIWDFDADDAKFQPVLDVLDAFVKQHAVTNVFVTQENVIGTKLNYERKPGNSDIIQHSHFYLQIPEKFVVSRYNSVAEIKGRYRDMKNVFKRSLDEISLEAIDTVLELISSNTLYRGEEWKFALSSFRSYKVEYDRLADPALKENFAWAMSVNAGPAIAKIRNHSIGVLLIDVTNDVDLDEAVRRYERIVAPCNYKRPKEIFTKKMLEDAKKTLMELGYMDSLSRRFATLDDITINNILFSNKDSAKRISGAMDIFAEMEKDVTSNAKKFSRVEEVTIDKFISDILPTASEIEAYVENKHTSNFVSLIAPEVRNSKTLFKWNNNFSWSYAGNMADSMKERVKSMGGKVDGDLRFSIQWNECGTDDSDLDAHCQEANGGHIYFRSAKKPCYSSTGGQLDVDIIAPGGEVAVENITWANKNTMKPGVYSFYVHQFSGNLKEGFRAEIEFNGQVYQFDYNNPVRRNETVHVADVILSADKSTFTLKERLPSTAASKTVWNITTNNFVPVSVICNSPNWWDTENGVGNKHYFFMLKDCINNEEPNSMFNEYLKEELLVHKRVFAALGTKMRLASAEDQLSGLGFSSTQRNELVVKIKGNTERIIKIKF